MQLLYQPTEAQLAVDEEPRKFDAEKFDAAIEWVYAQRNYSSSMLDESPGVELVRETANLLTEAFDQGIASGVIPPEMDAKLRESVFLFSACKTHHELSEVASMLRTDLGGIKPFEQFAREVKTVHEAYNVHYLNAEYKFAVSSAQMSAKWAEVERDGDAYDLQYRTANDSKVRHAHQLLHNKTLPPSDPFWDQYYPPNGWGCRCDAVQVRRAKYERSDPDQAAKDGHEATKQVSGNVDKGAIFRFNPGKSRQLFPPKHPYYKLAAVDKKHIIEAVENVKPITNKKELEAEIIRLADQTDWFERGFHQLDISREKGCNGHTNMDGSIFLSPSRMKNCISGVDKLKKGEDISFREADSIATLWHEITHNRNKRGNRSMNREQTANMELANEFISRNTLPEFYQAYGQTMEHKKLMNNRESTGYNKWVMAYTQVVELTKSDLNAVVSDVKKHLFNELYTEQEAGLINAIMKNQTVQKADGSSLNEKEVKRLIRGCFSSFGDCMTRNFERIIRCKD